MNIKSDYLFYTLIILFSLSYIFFTKNFEYYNDDFTMLEFNDKNYFYSFLKTDAWWRPLKNIFYNFFNLNFYSIAHPIIITKIIIHGSLTIIIYNFLKKIENNSSTILLSLIFFLAQTNFSSTFAIDTAGQLLVTFFGVISFIYIYRFVQTKKKIDLVFSYIFVVFAFLSKEIAVTFVILNIFTLIYYSNFNFIFKFKKISEKEVILNSLIFILIVVIYLAFRSNLGATWQPSNIGTDRYSLGIGFNLIKNFTLYFFSVVNPIDNLFFYLSFQNINILILLFIIVFFIFYLAYLTRYFIKYFNSEVFFRFLILIISCFPIILLNKIGELYTYSSTFFFIFLLQKLIPKNKVSILLILILLNLISSINKIKSVDLISNQKKEIDLLFNQIKGEIKDKDIYVLHNKSQYKYSYYHLPSFDWIYPIFQFKKDYGKAYNLIFDKKKLNEIKINNSIVIISSENKEKDFSLRPKTCFYFSYSSNKTICNF